ncbi:hypothetical protein CEXT_696521 [Caerostris extrusa]|uniref:Uncharacterized protein n=1 Tax=Caerostris extrusa TaxID=172846 RepID=A0AAV4S983_CAEEX|nr:hypothetical protein CEXT_696521 [Caerostris extrusa]
MGLGLPWGWCDNEEEDLFLPGTDELRQRIKFPNCIQNNFQLEHILNIYNRTLTLRSTAGKYPKDHEKDQISLFSRKNRKGCC